MRTFEVLFSVGIVGASLLSTAAARAEGTPPPDLTAVATGPAAAKDAPKIEKPANDVTAVTLGAGGLFASGNSKQLAVTGKGELEIRRDENGFGASAMGNYGESATGAAPRITNTENVQLRLRYDRFLSDKFSLFLIGTGRYDRFQGIQFRLNLDPGVKYIFLKEEGTAVWGEAGYDFQYDNRMDSSINTISGTDGSQLIVPKPSPVDPTQNIAKTQLDHSARVFLGVRHAFNENVTFGTGIELLQSFVDTDVSKKDTRINFDAVLAAKLFEGFSIGIGGSVRYDANPLPGKEKTDVIGNLSLIFAWSKKVEPPKKEEDTECPACQTPPPCNAAPPAPAAPTPGTLPSSGASVTVKPM